MATMKITNPKTGRSVNVRTWDIEPRTILALLRSGEIKTAKDISWRLLNERHSANAMAREMGGEDAGSNFALSVFEHGLDWALGIAVLNFIRQAAQRKRLPKPFKVACTRGGDVFVIGASGQVFA